jgi:hypothetical protein
MGRALDVDKARVFIFSIFALSQKAEVIKDFFKN